MLSQTLFAALLIAPTVAKTVWTRSDIDSRRLALSRVPSHTNTNDTNCVVGGYDDQTYAVHVGGPCSKLGANNKPMTGFRYLSMKTFYMDMADNNSETSNKTPVSLIYLNSSGQLQSQNKTTHSEVGALGSFKFNDDAISNARVFASITSYLAKSKVSFNTNDFVVGKTGQTYDTVKVCTQACPSGKCNKKCPATKTTANQGQYKFSIYAGAYTVSPASDKGWAKVVSKYGKGNPKKLAGVFNVYQYIDFTNMGSDKLTVTGPSSSVTFANMKDCPKATHQKCKQYPVKIIQVGFASGEALSYAFPTQYNRGEWTKTGSTFGSTPTDTKTVSITAIKPDAAWRKEIGSTITQLIAVRYTFDVTGVTANDNGNSGSFMVYDPTVSKVSKMSSGVLSGSMTFSRGCFAAFLTLISAMIVL
jgi:hypothetical protein